MDIGIYALPTYFPESHGSVAAFYSSICDLFVQAEDRNFASAWVNEHHFHPYGGMIPAPAVLLSAVAARTSRIRLGTSVSLLPLHNPLEVAEAYAMVDQLSGGRLDFGVGRGFVENDYQMMGVPFGEGQERVVEALEVITALWRDRPFDGHRGRFYTVAATDLWPPPLQSPHPPVWAAVTSNPESFDFWGRRGCNLLTLVYQRPLQETRVLVDRWRDAAKANGHNESGLRVGVHVMVVCHEDRTQARRLGERALSSYFSQHASARSGGAPIPARASFDEVVRGARICVGDPVSCTAMLHRLEETVGVDSADCSFYWGDLTTAEATASFDLFSSAVLPSFA